ncbi:MAG: hypothetical protein ACKVGZ_10915 [Alphaproteobacteria bacterium]|jgi:predicted metal-dependent enzyme (double-stranded beta helix superfamily)
MFELDRFIDDCKQAVASDPTHKAAQEVVARAVSDPASVLKALGEPTRAGAKALYHSPELTILNIAWGPYMTVYPHNHEMWAVIGMYGGREDNMFWRRVADAPDGLIEAAGAKALSVGDCTPLGKDIIHSVTNPLAKISSAIHVYGGDFFEIHRSEWDAERLTEQAYDGAKTMALLEASNRFLDVA